MGVPTDDVVSLTILVELVKCFERNFSAGWYWATRAGLSRRFLRMVTGYFSMQRFLVQDGCSSEATESMAALTAGSRLSCAPVAQRRAARALASGERHEVRGRRGPERPRHGGDSEHARATEHQTVLDSLGGVGNGAMEDSGRFKSQYTSRALKPVSESGRSTAKAASTIWQLNSVEGVRRHSARQRGSRR